MGGGLAVTIRMPDGTWYKMDRWTNPTPYTFVDPNFLSGGKTLTDYIAQWTEMCEAYDSGTYERDAPMASVYCNREYSSRDLITPSEYGIVFIDFQDKLFLSMNGYASYEAVTAIKIRLMAKTLGDEDRAWMTRMLSRITGHRDIDKAASRKAGHPVWIENKVQFDTIEDWIAHAEATDVMNYDEYTLDWSEWSMNEFRDDNDGSLAMLELLEEHGVELSAKERQGFIQFRNYEEEE